MRAIVQHRYGAPDVLAMERIDRPRIGEREVLVRVRAAALHVGDAFAVRGSPFPVRVMSGLRRPRYGVPGLDVAGVVEAVGSAVSRFRVGHEVFGVANGSCAEYTRASEDKLALKPAGLTFEEAAAIPTSALAALHGLRDAGNLRPGQSVLINGASGGVGTFAVQIAKALGAEVTAVCSTGNTEMVRSIGADHVADHTREDLAQTDRRYDLILDNVENRSLVELRRILAPAGTIVLNSGTGANGFGMFVRLMRPLLWSIFSRQKMRRFLSLADAAGLADLTSLIESGKLRPVIDRRYALAETPVALSHIETGHAKGKVVIAVAA